MSESAPKQDLVKATLRVDPGAGNKLTGNTASTEKTGLNTGWNKRERGTTTTYTQRVDYLKEHSQGHAFAEGLKRGHGGDTVPDDTRGVSCAEGHAVLQAHDTLATRGFSAARGNFGQLQNEVFGRHAQERELPKTQPSAWTDKAGYDAFGQTKAAVQRDTKATMDSFLAFTGMDSWQEYAKAEADYLAWNDIQKHGQFTSIKHDPESDISAGKDMDPCTQCSERIVKRMSHSH